MGNYLDKTGLTYFWGKLKDYFQPKLVSGTNIKTINNESVLGSGNITVGGEQLYTVVSASISSSFLPNDGTVLLAQITNDGTPVLTPDNLSKVMLYYRTLGKSQGQYYYYPLVIKRVYANTEYTTLYFECCSNYNGYGGSPSTTSYFAAGQMVAVAPFTMQGCSISPLVM